MRSMWLGGIAMAWAGCAGAPASDLDDLFDSDDTDLVDAPDTDDSDEDTDDSGADTDDTDVPPTLAWDLSGWTTDWRDAFTIDTAANGAKGTITFSVDTVAVGGPAALWLGSTRFTQDYDEEHTLAQTSAETDGSASSYERVLLCGDSPPNTADADSVFQCSASVDGFTPGATNQQVTMAMAVWPENASDASGTPADCIVFGHDPAVMLGSSVPSSLNPPAWLTAANCRNVNP